MANTITHRYCLELLYCRDLAINSTRETKRILAVKDTLGGLCTILPQNSFDMQNPHLTIHMLFEVIATLLMAEQM